MAWAVRASTNTLATPDNLARWGRPVDLKCSMEGCSAPNTGSMVGIRGFKKLRGTLARLALLGSYRIWLARRSQEWSSGELITSGH